MTEAIIYIIGSCIGTFLIALTLFGGGIKPSERIVTSLYDYDNIDED